MYINFKLNNINFINFLIEIDNIVLKLLVNNFKKWFNIEKDYFSVLEYLIPSVIENEKNNNEENDEDENIFILNVPLNKKNIDVDFYNDKKELINFTNNNIKINTSRNIIKLNGIILDKERCYCSWELIQSQLI